MLIIPCPFCGDRPEAEFAYAGQAGLARPADPSALSDEEWASFLYLRDNPKGTHRERWRHAHGCGQFFNAERHTVTDRIARSWRSGESA